MAYTELWRKIAIMVKLNLYKADGEPFRIFRDSEECLGVPYQTSWNWILNKAKPQADTVQRVVNALNEQFAISPPLAAEQLNDRTSAYDFGIALGAPAHEVAGAVLATHDDSNPLQRFAFDDRAQAWDVQSRLSGSYIVERVTGRTREHDVLELCIDTVLPIDDRFFIHATLEIPADRGHSYLYNGVVCERSGLMYWVFSQKNVELHDFLFMVTDRIYVSGSNKFTAKGTMTTMGQSRPAPISASVV
ncbi:MAG TPA: hypothetical protein VF614_03885, partial [Chthoniobacteraceae bacterium]